jgi:hypothetical protein
MSSTKLRRLGATNQTVDRMSYRVIFDVADRFPDIGLGVAAVVVLAGVILAGLWAFEGVIARWPLVLTAGASLAAFEAIINRQLVFLVGSLAIFAIVAAAEEYNRRFPAPGLLKRPPLGGAGTAVGLFLLIYAALTGLAMIPATRLSDQLAGGQAEVIEGPVTIYLEVASGKNECISVADRRFCYSDWVITPGFNRTRALGGPMGNGLQVRLSAIENTIVRVELADAP